jgi:hypothetical protein
MEWSQSGECLRGRWTMREFQEANAGSRPQVDARRAGKGGVVGGRGILDYGGGREVDFMLILELCDGKVFRETRYYADPFEASDARARWFSRWNARRPTPAKFHTSPLAGATSRRLPLPATPEHLSQVDYLRMPGGHF